MRRERDLEQYYFVRGWQQEYAFRTGAVFHLMDPDMNQEVYGVPRYLSALQSAWLNEAATLFLRKHYKNGSHAGFIFYMTDVSASNADVNNLRQAMRDSKGPGNFRNQFLFAPNGKKDGIQILPVSDVAAKDEFFASMDGSGIDYLSESCYRAGHNCCRHALCPAHLIGHQEVVKSSVSIKGLYSFLDLDQAVSNNIMPNPPTMRNG